MSPTDNMAQGFHKCFYTKISGSNSNDTSLFSNSKDLAQISMSLA